MIITQAHLNNTYDIQGSVGTMIYSALKSFVGYEFDEAEKNIRLECYDLCKGTYMDHKSFFKIVKKHLSK